VNASANALVLDWSTVRRLLDTPDPPTRRAAPAMWNASLPDRTLVEIADLLGIDRRTVARWLEADAPPPGEGPPPAVRPGRPPGRVTR
jgi:hypothetical protein